MTAKVWISSVLSNYDIGNKQGLRTKFYGHDWNPASLVLPLSPDEVHEAAKLYTRGCVLERANFPEAAAVWDQKLFKKVKDIFTAGGFYVVRGKIAETLSHFDLGEGGLIPFTIFKADLVTPLDGEFFLLNFGARKSSFLPNKSEDAQKFFVDKNTGVQFWKVNYLNEEAVVTLSEKALAGADLWFEESVHNKIFMSDNLAQALIDIGMKDVFQLKECLVVEGVA